MSVSILWNPFMPSVNIRSKVVWDNDGSSSSSSSDDNSSSNNSSSSNNVTNYDNIYDAIDAEGVGATVMVNGKEMAAVAADGYTGTNQSTVGSSGYTSIDAIADAAMSSGNGNDSVNLDAFGGAGEEITTFNYGGDNDDDSVNLDAFGGAGEEITTFNYGGDNDDDNTSDSTATNTIGSSGYTSLDAIANNATSSDVGSDVGSDETAVGQMGAVNVENANASNGSGSLVTGGASEEAEAGFATINSNQGGGELGSEFGNEKYSSDIISYAEEMGMTSSSVQSVANLDAYSMQNGKLVLNSNPTLMWDGAKLVDNPDYANEVTQNETMTEGVANGFGSNSDLTGGTSSVSAYDTAYSNLTNEQKMLVESGQATLSEDGVFTDLRNIGGSTIENTGEVNVGTGDATLNDGTSVPFEDMTTGLVYTEEGGELLNGTFGGVEYVDGVAVVEASETSLENVTKGATEPYFDMTDGQDLLKNADGSLFTGEYDGKEYVNGEVVTSGDDGVTVDENDGYMFYDGYLFKDGVAFSGDYEGATYVDGVAVKDSDENTQNAYDIAYAALTNEQKMLIESGQATLGENGVFTDLRTGDDEIIGGGDEAATGPTMQDGFMVNADGSLFTGTENGIEYVDGVPVVTGGGDENGGDGVATGPTLDANGVLVNADGSLFNGTFEGKTYEDGLEVTEGGGDENTGPSFNASGQLVNSDGTMFTGTFGGKQYVNGVEQNDDDNSSSTGPTMNADGLLANADGTLFTGTFEGKEYVNGVAVEGGDSVDVGDTPITLKYPDGTIFTGTVDADGNVFDADGTQIGTYIGGVFTRNDGLTVEGDLQAVTIGMNDGTTINGFIDGDNVVDADGNILGTINDQGKFVPAGSGGTIDEANTGTVDTGFTVTDGVIYDADGNIIGYEDGYQSDTETLKENLASATGNSYTTYNGMTRAEVTALIEEMMAGFNSANYDPATFMNAFGFALDPNFSGAVIPSFMAGSQSGVYARRLVKDRDTGEYRYIDVPIGGAFSQATDSQRMQRRQGFGSVINF